jgi:polysaccharide biosynthesis/export protein
MQNNRKTFVAAAATGIGMLFLLVLPSFGEASDYRVGADDLLKISVFLHPELSVDSRVSKSGKITFPLLGEIDATGLSTADLEQVLTQRLQEGGYVRGPHVSVLVTEYESQLIAVMGQVTKPGQYALTNSSKVLDLLAKAGGVINETAGNEATLVRHDGSKMSIDLHALFEGDPAQNPAVVGGDTIYVPRTPVFYVYGEVQKPGVYRLERNMTVTQAISAGGGLTPKGSQYRLSVKRRDPSGNMRDVSVKGQDFLQPDDVLSVKESWF